VLGVKDANDPLNQLLYARDGERIAWHNNSICVLEHQDMFERHFANPKEPWQDQQRSLAVSTGDVLPLDIFDGSAGGKMHSTKVSQSLPLSFPSLS
jgi:hypothetical protein